MIKVLMVCLGNICRSPLAEGILKSKVNKKNVFVDSAGTAAYHVGNAPDKRSIAVAAKHGIDITTQKARKFSLRDFDTFDIIFTMDKSNYQDIIALARNQNDLSKVKMVLTEIEGNENENVPDPYYGGEKGFDNVYKMLEEACEVIAVQMAKK